MKGGTIRVTPFSRVAGLFEFEAVAPFSWGSVLATVSSIEAGSATPIGVALPASMELTVATTEPQLKGATASNSNKPATLENGVTLMVPPFIGEGEKIRVNPSESKYMERVK